MAVPFSLDLADSRPLNSGLILRNFLVDSSLALDYQSTWQAMQSFTRQRDSQAPDEIWILQHAAVYTLGQAGKAAHILDAADVPVVKVDRGGQVTYHGPGQLMCYVLLNLRRYDLGVRDLVLMLEESVIALLAELNIQGVGDRDAPGVYVDGNKIAALGLRVSRGCSYHGLCLNVDFDASPFDGINPCGYEGMKTAQISDFMSLSLIEAGQRLSNIIADKLTHKSPGAP